MASLLVRARTSVRRRPRPSQRHRRWGGTAGVPRGPRLFLLPLSGWCAASAVTASRDTWLSPRGASVPAWCSSRLFVQRVVVEGRCGRLLFLSMLNLNIFTTLLSPSGCFAAALCFFRRMLCRRCRLRCRLLSGRKLCRHCHLGGSFCRRRLLFSRCLAVDCQAIGWMLCCHIVADIGLMLCHHGCTLVGQHFV